MAGRDYVTCGDCGTRIVYDGQDFIRDDLEKRFGDIKADSWTVELLCPPCITKLRNEIERLAAVGKGIGE